jgi:hypothetical protein
MASLISAVVLAVAAAMPGTAPLGVTVVAHAGAKEPAPPTGVLHIVAVGGAGMREASPVSVLFHGSAATDVKLPAGLVWEVRAEAEGWWSPPVTVFVDGAAASASLDLWPACELRGAVTTPEAEKPPPSLAVHFAATNPAVVRNGILVVPEKDKPPFGDVACPVKDGRFACTVAAGTLDVKLKAAGFVPHYLWGKKLPAHGQLDLGTLTLKPGASLAGKVSTTEGPADPKACELRLKPLEPGMPRLEEMSRARARVTTTRPDARGFFSFDGLDPGGYTLEARQPGFAPAVRAPIRIEPRSETELSDRLVLERPLTLSVEVRPPEDPNGNPWTVQVLGRTRGAAGQTQDVFKQTASREGTLEKQNVAPGTYVAMLFDGEGQPYLWQEFELSASSPPLVLEIRPVPVTGTVTLGKKPLAADLSFSGNGIGPTLHSDEHGAFAGVLPHDGSWGVHVTAATPPVQRRLRNVEVKLNPDLKKAEVDLHLPDNRLTGTVVDEGGQPVANAAVTALTKDDVDIANTRSDDDGRFELEGLAGGRVAVRAEDYKREQRRYSDEVNVELDEEGAAAEVRLVLRRANEVVLTVSSETGDPVPGATVLPLGDPSRAGALAFSSLATDASGTVRIPLPSDVERLAGVVLPPGYALQAFDVTLQAGRAASVVVTRFGGTLRLRLPSPLSGQDWSRALLGWQDGMLVPSYALLEWAQVNGVAVDYRGTRFTIPQVAPGGYRLCLGPVAQLLAESSSSEGHWEGATCADGFLPRLGELSLELQPPS